MARACELAGNRLIALPDGEIGERSDRYPAGDRSQWVAGLAGRLAGEDSLFEVVDEGTMNERGFPVDFDSATRLRPRVRRAELADRLEFGYDTFALRSWPYFERLRASTGQPDLPPSSTAGRRRTNSPTCTSPSPPASHRPPSNPPPTGHCAA